MVQFANKVGFAETNLLKMDEIDFVPQNLNGFIKNSITDRWNHFIFSLILNENKDIKINKINEIKKNNIHVNINNKLKNNLIKKFNFFGKKNKHVNYRTYLPINKYIALELKFFQIPQIFRFTEELFFNFDNRLRKFKLKLEGNNRFEKTFIKNLNKQIPISYLENFSQNRKQIFSMNLNMEPKSIFTSNGHLGNDLFNLYTAECMLRGSKIFIGQHGGHIGIGKFDLEEEHERHISDYNLSMG